MLENVREPQGLRVTIKSYRKDCHGTTKSGRPKKAGRKGSTGKSGVVRNGDGDVIGQFKEPTITALRTVLRRKYNIDPNLAISKSGTTSF